MTLMCPILEWWEKRTQNEMETAVVNAVGNKVMSVQHPGKVGYVTSVSKGGSRVAVHVVGGVEETWDLSRLAFRLASIAQLTNGIRRFDTAS